MARQMPYLKIWKLKVLLTVHQIRLWGGTDYFDHSSDKEGRSRERSRKHALHLDVMKVFDYASFHLPSGDRSINPAFFAFVLHHAKRY